MIDPVITAHAKDYIDSLINGVDPLTGELLQDDIVLEKRINLCLRYVSGILGEILENPTKKRKQPKVALPKFNSEEFNPDDFVYEKRETVTISKIVDQINNLTPGEHKKLTSTDITNRLVKEGMLEDFVPGEGMKKYRRTTAKGRSCGISQIWKDAEQGKYLMILYDVNMQHYIVENLTALLNDEPLPQPKTNSEYASDSADDDIFEPVADDSAIDLLSDLPFPEDLPFSEGLPFPDVLPFDTNLLSINYEE